MTQALHLGSLNFFGAALHTSARVAKLNAADIANVDTPHYKARGLDFDKALTARLQGQPAVAAQYVRGLPTDLDGNDVSSDYESLQSAANSQRTRESLTFLTEDVQNLLTALNPQGNTSNGTP